MIIIRYTSPRLCIACPASRFTEFINDIERPLIRSERLRRLRPKRERNEMRGGPWIWKGPANYGESNQMRTCTHASLAWNDVLVMERLASLVNSPKQFDERNRESRVMVLEFHPFLLFCFGPSAQCHCLLPPFCFGYLTISSFVLRLSADPQHQKKKQKEKTKSREIYKRNWRFGVNREMATVIWTRPSLSTTVCWEGVLGVLDLGLLWLRSVKQKKTKKKHSIAKNKPE